MDPASLAASIITIVGLVGNVGTGLEKFYRLREAPEEVLALNNEISDFKAVLLRLGEIIDGLLQIDHDTAHHRRQLENLRSSASQLAVYIQRAKDQLLELEKLIEYRIVISPGAKEEKPSIKKFRFARAGREIKAFRHELHEIKGKIHMTLSVLTTSQVSQVRLRLSNVEAMVSQVQDQQRELNTVNVNILRDIQQAIAQREVTLGQHKQALLQNSAQTQESTPQEATASATPENAQSELLCQGRTRNASPSSYTKLNVLQVNTTYTPHPACNAWCSCTCHRQGGLHTPSFLQRVVGSLFVGYVGGLVQPPKCDEPRCSRPSQRSTRITYYFPIWFISCAITVAIRGPQVAITALRIRSRKEMVFIYARDDNWNQLMKLFDKGLASSLDVDQNGWSIQHWAVHYNSTKTCKVLLTLGADPDVEDKSLMTARDLAARKYLSRRNTQADALYQNFGFGHSIEEFQLSRLQKIILNLIPGDLEAELQYSTSSIDTQDSKGATALLWAAYLRNSVLVQLLLKHNADPNIADVMGTTPIHWVWDLSYECLMDLLSHGADSNVTDNLGIAPLHHVARHCHDPRFINVLVSNDESFNVQDANGATPLHYAARNENPTMMACLLEHGAEIDAQDILAYTPLFMAIANSSYKCLEVLLKAGTDCSIIRGNKGSILHLAAASADEAILQILTSFKISGIDCDLRDLHGQTAWDTFSARHGENDENGPRQDLVDAFRELLDTIREENLKLASTNGSDPKNGNHAKTSGDAAATSNPPVPGAWDLVE